MPNTSDGKVVKMTIVPCDCSGGKYTPRSGPIFEAMLNPSTLKHTQSILYDKTTAQGKSATSVKFKSMGDDTISFSLLFDGTGVVDPSTSNKNSVAGRIDQLRRVAHRYEGNEHQPHVVRVLWGKLIFFGRLQSLSIDYTLFKPSGEPLRAKVELSFIGSMSAKEEALEAKRSSPDLTHEVLFQAGDSLPLLCQRIYGDSAYYAAVARYNRIVNFRNVHPGTTIYFPPLR